MDHRIECVTAARNSFSTEHCTSFSSSLSVIISQNKANKERLRNLQKARLVFQDHLGMEIRTILGKTQLIKGMSNTNIHFHILYFSRVHHSVINMEIFGSCSSSNGFLHTYSFCLKLVGSQSNNKCLYADRITLFCFNASLREYYHRCRKTFKF